MQNKREKDDKQSMMLVILAKYIYYERTITTSLLVI